MAVFRDRELGSAPALQGCVISYSKPPPTTYFCDTDRDRWTERLSCLCCGTTGITHLSTANKFSWDIQVDSVSMGFKAIALAFGSKFVCSLCDDQTHP